MHIKTAVQNVDWEFEGQHYDLTFKASVQHGPTCSHTFTLRLMWKKNLNLKWVSYMALASWPRLLVRGTDGNWGTDSFFINLIKSLIMRSAPVKVNILDK